MLKELQEMVDDLTSTNSNNEKIERLAKYENLKKIIKYAHNPMMQFYVTSKTVEKYAKTNNKVSDEWTSVDEEGLFDLLDKLSTRELSGHNALNAVESYITGSGREEYKDLIYSVIDKNLKIRMSDTTINKVFPELIPEFKVQLADKIDIDKIPDFENEKWFASRKLDGVRCITIVKQGSVKFYSRTGKEFTTLDLVQKAIRKELISLSGLDFVLDGEMCIIDENGNEDFTSIIKVIRKKDYTILNPRYKIFDFLSLNDFLKKSSNEVFSSRYKVYSEIKSPSGILSPVEQVYIDNAKTFSELSEQADELGWEGLIVRKDVKYAGKRSKNMLKVKQFHEAEYEVQAITSGMIRFISKETGLEEEEIMLSNVVIEHLGNNVGVGSGFTLEQRQKFYENPDLIIGKTITVKYFEESQDKDGNVSLRFPVVKHIYDGAREV